MKAGAGCISVGLLVRLFDASPFRQNPLRHGEPFSLWSFFWTRQCDVWSICHFLLLKSVSRSS